MWLGLGFVPGDVDWQGAVPDAGVKALASLPMRVAMFLSAAALLVGAAAAQNSSGTAKTGAGTGAGALEFSARITPTGARSEPVRQFTFYILTKSYTEIVKEAEEKDPVPSREEFIDGLKFSRELRDWMKAKDTMDLSAPDMDKRISPEDILGVPEFLLAYQRSNSGGVTSGFPKPKFTDLDKAKDPEKYKKLREEYLAALMKFLRKHPESTTGMELELEGINPQRKWEVLQNARDKRVGRAAPELAQLKFLARRADTDLEGHASVSGLPPGDYWISTLNLEANAGDMRVRWDVPVKIEAGQTARVELTNLNTTEASSTNP
ncbi:MAG TPA: carboxypeptidase-like regulatory domain-containing protein [Candidatus Acidoferrum sp.]|nr:carboxypeptidase-like regulatory domain-containing protein [Candidatus Acidoferrum sp.]